MSPIPIAYLDCMEESVQPFQDGLNANFELVHVAIVMGMDIAAMQLAPILSGASQEPPPSRIGTNTNATPETFKIPRVIVAGRTVNGQELERLVELVQGAPQKTFLVSLPLEYQHPSVVPSAKKLAWWLNKQLEDGVITATTVE